MSEPTTLELWRQCVKPGCGPDEPVEGFEILAAAVEPINLGSSGGIRYRTVRCLWIDDEWVDQLEQIIARAEPHEIDEPQEELDDAWNAFCLRVDDLNRERERERRLTEAVVAPEPRSRLSDLALPIDAADADSMRATLEQAPDRGGER
jgi:hypothetical protein